MFPDEFDQYEHLDDWEYADREAAGLDGGGCHLSQTQYCEKQCCVDCCAGPMGPRGPRGFRGPAGAGLETVLPFVEGTPYRNGTIVFYNGAMYQVARNNPVGIPGMSPDFLLVTAAGPTGPQGPVGATGAIGAAGPVGATGATGPQGPTGPTGPQGPVGATGAAGPQGLAGATGATGPQGPTGPAGSQGPAGATGAAGPQGPTGPAGSQGPAGTTGATGPQGPMGPTGPQGPAGATGTAGSQGPAGATGAAGPQGPIGPAGATGPTGPQGPAGAAGAMGPTGPAGATGAVGPTGPIGPTGPTGPAGPTGTGLDRVEAFIPGKSYPSRKMVFHNGALYQAVKDAPAGTPGTSSDFELVTATGPAGPEGPAGLGLDRVEAFEPGKSYSAGKIVFHNGALYQAVKDTPAGTPETSPDFELVTAAGPTGPTGPTGPAGPAPKLNLVFTGNGGIQTRKSGENLTISAVMLQEGDAIFCPPGTENFILKETGFYEVFFKVDCSCDPQGELLSYAGLQLICDGQTAMGGYEKTDFINKEETKVLVGQTVIPVISAPVNVSVEAVSSGSAQYSTIKLIIRKID